MKYIIALSCLVLLASIGLKNPSGIIEDKPLHIIKGESTDFESKHNQSEVFKKEPLVQINVLESQLVSHSKFIFLENLDMSIEDLNPDNICTQEYFEDADGLVCYELKSEELINKYSGLLNKKVMINNWNRTQREVKIKDLVIVLESYAEQPFLACTVDLDHADNIYYAWASTSPKNNFYPFNLFESDSLQETLEEEVRTSKSFEEFSEFNYEDFPNEDIYDESTFEMYSSASGETYVLVQLNKIGTCRSIIDNLTFLYKSTSEGLELLAEGSVSNFSIDLIDVDNDGEPEVLMGDFASSTIYKPENGKFEVLQDFWWSTSECPC